LEDCLGFEPRLVTSKIILVAKIRRLSGEVPQCRPCPVLACYILALVCTLSEATSRGRLNVPSTRHRYSEGRTFISRDINNGSCSTTI
jgi:hypothetical protein